MSGVFPTLAAGGVIVRDAGGICVDPPGVLNAYCPPADFTTSCQITAMPEDCTARILPSQINAMVSEFLCLAATWTPEGNWDCDTQCNLATAFTAWYDANAPHGDGVTISTNAPFAVLPGAVAVICANEDAIAALASCLVSGDAANLLTVGTDPGLLVRVTTGGTLSGDGTVGNPLAVDIADLLDSICASNTFKNTLATCMISGTANNALTVSANGLFVNSASFVPVARAVNTQHSLTGGGALSANRTLNLVGDVAAPGNNMYYGTNAAGTRGWYPIAVSTMFESTQQTITTNGALTIAHGLGVKPRNFWASAICVVADQGYSVGQEVSLNPNIWYDGDNNGILLAADATNLYIRFSNQAPVFNWPNLGTGGSPAAMNPANWRLILRATP